MRATGIEPARVGQTTPRKAQRSHMKEATCNVRVAVLPPGFEAGALSI